MAKTGSPSNVSERTLGTSSAFGCDTLNPGVTNGDMMTGTYDNMRLVQLAGFVRNQPHVEIVGDLYILPVFAD